jgi:hypothetical protein
VPPLPAWAWALASVALFLLLALAALGPLAVLRLLRRRASRRLSGPATLLALLLGAAPWLVVWLAPIRIVAAISSPGELTLWLLAALAAFVLLVPLPLGALTAGVLWLASARPARRHQADRD